MLSLAEKRAGRLFRERARGIMQSRIPEHADLVPLGLRYVRHECPKHAGRTWALYLQENYLLSPQMEVCEQGQPWGHEPAEHDCGEKSVLREGLYAWLWSSGRCVCGYAAYANDGRLVLREVRPPLHGAVEVVVRLDPTG